MDRTHETYRLTALTSSLTNLMPQMPYVGNFNSQSYNKIKSAQNLSSHKFKF
jgi:hypothetical protein